jgi:16S rRNA (guanine527-N7)-methyltransferase
LTSIVDTKEILGIHFGECMFAAHAVPIGHGRLADVGSGAGFPGLALKLLLPELQVSLIESNSRKAVFLSEAVRTLELSAVEVTHARFRNFREAVPAFDFIASRALGRWAELLSWAREALHPGGRVVLWLGREDALELSNLRKWDWRSPIPLPGAEKRVLLIGRPRQGVSSPDKSVPRETPSSRRPAKCWKPESTKFDFLTCST